MFANSNRHVLALLTLLLINLGASACSKKAGDVQPDTAASAAPSTPISARSAAAQQVEGRHAMGSEVEGHGTEHDESHGGKHP